MVFQGSYKGSRRVLEGYCRVVGVSRGVLEVEGLWFGVGGLDDQQKHNFRDVWRMGLEAYELGYGSVEMLPCNSPSTTPQARNPQSINGNLYRL